MSFTPVDNGDGIFHTGYHMDWDTVDNTTIVMATITKDAKVLIQHVSYDNGTTTVETPSFVTQLTVPDGADFGAAFPCLAICSIDATHAAIRVGTTFAAQQYFAFGDGFSRRLTGITTNTVLVPTYHAFFIMEKGADGWSLVGQGTTFASGVSYGNPIGIPDSDILWDATNSRIIFSAPTSGIFASMWWGMQLTYVSVSTDFTAVGAPTRANSDGVLWITSNSNLSVSRKAAYQDRTEFLHCYDRTFAAGNIVQKTSNMLSATRSSTFPTAVLPTALGSGDSCNVAAYLQVNGFNAVNYTGTKTYNSNDISTTALHTAWVDANNICVLGTNTADGKAPCNGPYDFTQAQQSGLSDIQQIFVDFTYIPDTTFLTAFPTFVYRSPYKNTKLPYYTDTWLQKPAKQIKRLDDNAFWLVGPFSAAEADPQKISVITVHKEGA